MSLVKCRTLGCKHMIREGLRRSQFGEGSQGQKLADGMYCWRCRARMTPSAVRAARKTRRKTGPPMLVPR